MKIQCLGIRAGGTKVDLDGLEYHFEPLEDGAHVAEVADEAHIDRFLSINDHYKVYHGKLEPKGTPERIAPAGRTFVAKAVKAPVSTEMLYGSSVHESSYEIGGKTYALGDIVATAHKNSNLTTEEWNELEEDERAAKIDIALDDLAEAAEQLPPEGEKPDERAALVEAYKAKFGKAPHHKLSDDKIKAQLAE